MAAARLKHVVLWFGLAVCGYALWRSREVAGDEIGRIGWLGWVATALLLLLCWASAVVAWRRYLLAYTGQDPGWRTAVRQLGLLLVGKYIPGGVFGFLARVYDSSVTSRAPVVWAGLSEQAAGVGLSAMVGALLLLAAVSHNPGWLVLLTILPLIMLALVWLLHHFISRLPWIGRKIDVNVVPQWSRCLQAVSVHLIQLLTWGTLIAMLSVMLYGLDDLASAGVAGAFLLAVGAGMVVVFMPGGIGVRETALVALSGPWLELSQAVFLAALLRLITTLLDAAAGLLATAAGSPGDSE